MLKYVGETGQPLIKSVGQSVFHGKDGACKSSGGLAEKRKQAQLFAVPRLQMKLKLIAETSV